MCIAIELDSSCRVDCWHTGKDWTERVTQVLREVLCAWLYSSFKGAQNSSSKSFSFIWHKRKKISSNVSIRSQHSWIKSTWVLKEIELRIIMISFNKKVIYKSTSSILLWFRRPYWAHSTQIKSKHCWKEWGHRTQDKQNQDHFHTGPSVNSCMCLNDSSMPSEEARDKDWNREDPVPGKEEIFILYCNVCKDSLPRNTSKCFHQRELILSTEYMKHKTIKFVGVMRKVPISGFKHLPHNINKMGEKSQQWEQKKN